MSGSNAVESMIALLREANDLRRRSEYGAALDLYGRALERFGSSAPLLAQIAECHYRLAIGNPHETGASYEAATVWMEKAIALAPDDAHLHARLAEYCELGTLDIERAAREYRKAIELSPCEVNALIGGARLYGLPEKVVTLDEAITWLERATDLEPDNPELHHSLAWLYRERGQVSDAERREIRALLCREPLWSATRADRDGVAPK